MGKIKSGQPCALLVTSLVLTSLCGLVQLLPSERRDVVEGESIRLECRFHAALASASTLYYWIRTNKDGKDNAAIKEDALDSHYNVEFSPQEGKYDLIISRAQYDKDNGHFECKLKESGSGADIYNVAFIITVLIPPGAPQITPPHPVGREGEPFALSCISEGGSPDPLIQWYREGAPLQGQLQKGGSRDRPTSSVLTISPRMEDDGATYRCSVWNRAIREEMRMETSVTLRVHYAPRVTVGPYNPLNVMANTDAVLTCSVMANPPVRSVRWVKSNHLLSNTHNHTIPGVTPQDSGLYTCMADNGVGEATQANLELSVLHGPEVKVLPSKEVSLGESLAVKCNVASNPSPYLLKWLKDDDPYFKQSGDTLRLDAISADDSGKYTCQASVTFRASGSAIQSESTGNASVIINVKHKPGETDIYPTHPIAISGEPFTLTCSARPAGWPVPEYRWWKEGEQAELGKRANYTILSAHVSHEGQYYCQPQNHLGHGSISSVYLTVHEPAIVILPLRPQVIRKDGDSGFSVACRARGKPKPRVRWLHNGKEILQENGFFKIITNNSMEAGSAYSVQSTLLFDGVNRKAGSMIPSDRGQYICEYDNGFGESATSEMMLKIQHSPVVRHTYNRVAFDVGETAVLYCKMQAYPQPTFEWFANGSTLSDNDNYGTNITDIGDDIYAGVLSIKDIKEKDYGEYTCRAWNQVGDDKKTIIRLVKKDAPDRPYNLEVVDENSDKITLRWMEGFNGGFSNTEFLITYTNVETGHSKNESCRTQNVCQVTGLQSDTEYRFKVLAVNRRGYSPYSDDYIVKTRVNLKDVPRAKEAHFDKESHQLTFSVEPTTLNLIAKVQAKSLGHDNWNFEKKTPVKGTDGYIYFPPPKEGFSDMRVILCLSSNDSWCGDAKLASLFEDLPRSRETQPPISTENLIVIVAISGAIFLILMLIVICCCWCRKGKNGKKDYEMESSNVRPKAVTGPYYPEGNLNKRPDNSMDNITKPSMYLVNMPDNGGNLAHITNSPNSLIYSQDRDLGHSQDSHSDLWMKSANDLPPEGSYHPFDGGLPNSYFYPEDYQSLNEEVMNMKNREHLHTPYYDVSGLPDPYVMGDEEKAQQISFDESLESGYSTPNSRSRRVIREIIV